MGIEGYGKSFIDRHLEKVLLEHIRIANPPKKRTINDEYVYRIINNAFGNFRQRTAQDTMGR